jgi:hypothetical protein
MDEYVMAFQNITPIKLGQAAITTGVTTLYTVPASTRTLLKEFSIANTTGAPINVRVFLVPAAGTAGTSNAFLYDVPIPNANVLQYNGIEVLNAGDTIQIQAAATGLTIIASGAEAI